MEPRKSRWKSLCVNLGISAATLGACFLVLEVVLRFAGYGNLEIYQPDPHLYWRLKPNQQCFTKIDRKRVRINSLGTRGPEFAPTKPPGTFRILSLGDSRTFGWGMAEAETYTARLGDLLQAQYSTQRVEVINAGVNAWSYQQMLVYLREFGMAYRPDLVVIGEANLWTQFSEQNSREFVQKFMNRVRLKNLLRRFATYHYIVEVKLKNFYEKHRTKFIPVDPKQDTLFKEQQQSEPSAVFQAAISNMCSLALSNGAQPVLLFLPTEDQLRGTNEPMALVAKRSVARALGVTLVEPTQRLVSEPKALYLDADPVHFNTRGNELIACELFIAITNVAKP